MSHVCFAVGVALFGLLSLPAGAFVPPAGRLVSRRPLGAQAEAAVAALSDRGHILGEGDASHENTILQDIVAKRREDVAASRASVSFEMLEAQAEALVQSHGGPISLFDRVLATRPRLAVAAEFKRASPSKGDIAVGLAAGDQGVRYAEAGAAVISVLTEGKWFKGSLEDMRDVRLATQARAPEGQRPAILRKDFIIDEYQLYEARAFGADTVLLIVAVLGRQELVQLIEKCRELGMEPLVEVANEIEAEIAALAGARVVGVNNRNLHTFKLDMTTTPRVSNKFRELGMPFEGERPERLLLALSGIMGPEDLNFGAETGVAGILVGEALMRAGDPGLAIQNLLGDAEATASSPLVKVCGITTPEDALAACEAGANLVGVIFATSKRQVDTATARGIVERVRSFGERDAALPLQAKIVTSGKDDPASHFQSCGNLIKLATARRPGVVGVFMDQPVDEVLAAADAAGLDAIQLHGDESWDEVAAVASGAKVPVIRVLHVDVEAAAAGDALLADATRAAAAGCAALLLDSSVRGQRGGTGVSFDWTLAKALGDAGIPVLVAGGLGSTAGDTGACLRQSGMLALGVDASSGLEVDGQPGVKDAARVRAYISEAKDAASATA